MGNIVVQTIGYNVGTLFQSHQLYSAATKGRLSYTGYKPPSHLVSSDDAPVVVGQDFQSLSEDAWFPL